MLSDVGSTNNEAIAAGMAGDPGQLWITARRQTAGRGRRGRAWVSEPGNLYSSLLLVDPQPTEKIGLLPLVVSLALREAIAPHLPDPHRLKLKWPNDLLLGGAKISGILLERSLRADGTAMIVIGCGVNCAHHPEGGLYPATNLQEAGTGLTPENLFPNYAKALAIYLDHWRSADGRAGLVREWLAHAQGVGEPIIVRFPDEEARGTFAGLDADGYLLLQHNGDTRRIMAGDVFFSPHS